MFSPPQEIETRVFAELPGDLRVREKRSAWAFGLTDGEMHSYLEGPSFDRSGRLFVVDIPYGRIFEISSEGRFALFAEYDGWPNGLKIHRDGRIFIADHLHGIMVLDPVTRRVQPLLTRVHREGLKGVNDLVFASNGDLYFTDQGQSGLDDPSGRIYRMTPLGNVECLMRNIPSPNGLVLTPDERHLLVAVTRANQIWRLPIHPDGTTTKVAAFITLCGGLAGPDGLAIDQQGNLAIAHCGLGTVWVFSRLGEPVYRIRSCKGLSTTNIAYGGPDGRSLFITESDSGTILRAELPVPGQPMFSHTLPGSQPQTGRA